MSEWPPKQVDEAAAQILGEIAANQGATRAQACADWKALGDGAKSLSELHHQRSRGELAKTAATAVVPLLSLLTLAVTVAMQSCQLQATRDAAEDISWRDTVNHLVTATYDSPGAGFAISAELKSFFASERYARQARQLAILSLPRIADPVGFGDLLASAVGPHPAWKDLDDLLTVDRIIAEHFWTMEEGIKTYDPKKGMPGYQTIGGRRPSREDLQAQQAFMLRSIGLVSKYICDILRTDRPASGEIDLHDVFLYQCNLNGADLRRAKLANARLEATTVHQAKLDATDGPETTEWVNTAWWLAASISSPLLDHLVARQYPYFSADIKYDEEPPSKEEYARLLRSFDAKITNIPFGTPSPTPASQ
jgi:hypothetical protein